MTNAITQVLLMSLFSLIDEYFCEEKSSFKVLGLSFSSKKLEWGSYIVSIARTVYEVSCS